MAKYQVTDQQIESLFKRIKHLEKTLEKDLTKAARLGHQATLGGLLSAVHLLDLDDQLEDYNPLVGYFERNKDKNDLWK